jgi:hypothetical protein
MTHSELIDEEKLIKESKENEEEHGPAMRGRGGMNTVLSACLSRHRLVEVEYGLN